MNLTEWKEKIDKSKEYQLSPRQIEAGVTANPQDYYFAVFTDKEYMTKYVDGKFINISRTCAMICPRKFFDQNGHLYDGHVIAGGPLDIPGFGEDMECIISALEDMQPAEMHELLDDIGFEWSEKFAKFCDYGDRSYKTAYFPSK